MSTPQTPQHVPTPEFDAICSEMQEFEHLPTVKAVPVRPAAAAGEDERTAPLDEQILAGLVSP